MEISIISPKEIKACIITGCAGFIGSHLTETCLRNGWYVYGIDKLSHCSSPEFMDELKQRYPSQFKFIHNDINNIKHIPDDIDIIFNICAESHVQNSIENSKEFLESNINGVHNLLELIRHKKVRPLFYQMSTDEVYGDIIKGSHSETDILKPSNPYSFSKASADLLVMSYARTYGIQYKIGRATNTWGTRQNPEKLIPKTCKLLKLNKPIPLHNDGLPVRTWLNVNDCVSGILMIALKGKINEVYNIGGNEELENWKIVAKISHLMGKKPAAPIQIIRNPNNPVGERHILDSNFDYSYIGGAFETVNGFYVYKETGNDNSTITYTNMEDSYFDFVRDGQDVRYSLDDSKLRSLGWNNRYFLDNELPNIVKFYQSNFIW